MNNVGTKILIWESVERTIYASLYKRYLSLPAEVEKINYDSRFTGQPLEKVPVKELPRLSEYIAKQVYHEVLYYLAGNQSSNIAFIDESSGMLFYSPGVAMLAYDSGKRGLATVLAGIKRVNDLLAQKGITLVYIPLPDKENIYKHLLPPGFAGVTQENNFLKQLHEGLDAMGVLNVTLYDSYINSARSGEYLYFKDDTHWNEKGIEEAVKLTQQLLSREKILFESGSAGR